MRYIWCKTSEMKNRNLIEPYVAAYRNELEKTANDSIVNEAPCKKGKRFRSAFTTEQVSYLEKEFRKYPYIGTARRKDVSNVLNIPERAVKIWFQNRRMKEKKDLTKETDEKFMENNNDQVYKTRESIIGSSLPIIDSLKDPLIIANNEAYESTKTTHTKDKLTSNSKNYHIISPEKQTSQEHLNSITVIKHYPATENTSTNSSVDVFKKYKTENMDNLKGRQSYDSSSSNQEARENSPFNQVIYKPENVNCSHYTAPILPQDLSSKPIPQQGKTTTKENQEHQNLDVKLSATDLPLYWKGYYTQPYIPPGNMIWKPINVAPMVPPPMPMAFPSAGNAGQNMMRRDCNCDCHAMKPATLLFQQNAPQPNLQYVITALPFQNPSQKF